MSEKLQELLAKKKKEETERIAATGSELIAAAANKTELDPGRIYAKWNAPKKATRSR